MTYAQRVVAIFYCLLVVYCCAWVPWVLKAAQGRLGYDWIWSGVILFGEPDIPAVALRLIAATALRRSRLSFGWKMGIA